MGSRMLFAGQTLRLQSLASMDTPLIPANTISNTLTRLLIANNIKMTMRRTWRIEDLLTFLLGVPALQEAFIDGIPSDDPTDVPEA